MNKLKLIEMLRNRCAIKQTEATNIVNLFFSEMTKALERGERIEIRGLWSFYIKEYEAYTGRNPKTGKFVQISTKKLPFFKCGKELKERVDSEPN